jgi:lysozyme
MTREISEAGLTLIKRFEGLRLKAYLCPGDVWTIGYGHTAGVTAGMVIDEDEAHRLLREDVANTERAISNMIRVAMTDDQFAALTSWAFNVGSGAARGSSLRKRLNAGDYDAIPTELAKWRMAGGKVSNGLVRRRAAEAEMWSRTNIAPPSPLPVPRPDNPDRSSPAKSTTLQAVGVGGLTAVGGAIQAAVTADWRALAILAVVGLVLAVIMRERVRAWRDGWR